MKVQAFFANQKKRELWRVGSPLRFVVWGGIDAVLGYSIYAALILFFPYLVSYTLAYLAGIPISYFFNSRFVFCHELRWSKALKYPLVYVAHYMVGTACLYMLVEIFKVNRLLAPLLVLLLTIPVTFFLTRSIIRGNVENN